MARKTERVVIGGVQYQITQLGAVEGRGLYKKFVTAIGPLLREVISGPLLGDLQKQATTNEGDNAEANGLRMMQLIAPMLVRALEIVPSELFEELCATFTPCCLVGAGNDSAGKVMFLPLAEMFDMQFAGDYASMTAWLGHCIRINGFLGMLGSGNAAQVPAAATA
jgi:hypothetical protein